MEGRPQACSGCDRPFLLEEQSARCDLYCDGCETTTHALLFPALHRPPETVHNQLLIDGANEASCFYHATRKAVVPCDGCGRFLCSLCDVPLDEGHWCPGCVQEGRQQPDKMQKLENRRTLYDTAALWLAILPIFTFWGPVFTAPATLFIVFRYWNKPRSILGRTRIRLVIAGLLALLEIFAIVSFIIFLITEARGG